MMRATLILPLLTAACAPVRVLPEEPASNTDTPEQMDDDGAEDGGDDQAQRDYPLVGADGDGLPATITPPGAAWTVMVFINGDNELETAALDDVNEMEQVGSTDQVNIIVQIDRSSGYDRSDGDWRGTRRLRVEADEDTRAIGSPVLADLGSTDAGSPETIIDFVSWAAENYPAQRYAFVMWDHGWGWSFAPDTRPVVTKGISSDYTSGNDISVAEGELAQILAGAVEATGQPLSIVGFDACVMASWEVAYASAPYAEVFVASQDYESEDGWAYDATLADLVARPQMSPAELGDAIALRFSETRDSTQSVIDLAALPEINRALDTLATAIMDSEGVEDELRSASGEALDFDGGWGTDHDLGDVLDLLAGSSEDAAVIAAAEDARGALDEVVLSNYTVGRAVSDAHGLSIYTPARGGLDTLYLEGIWSRETLWDDMLQVARPSR